MKRVLIIIAIAMCVSAGLSGCAVEATTYPDYYYGPEVRTRVYYYDTYPRYRYHYHRHYYTPRHYNYTPGRGYGHYRRGRYHR